MKNKRLLPTTLAMLVLALGTLPPRADAAGPYEGVLDGVYPERQEVVVFDGTMRLDEKTAIHLSTYRKGRITDLKSGMKVRFSLASGQNKPGERPRITELWVIQRLPHYEEE